MSVDAVVARMSVDEALDKARQHRQGGDLDGSQYWLGVAAGVLAAWLPGFSTPDLWADDLAAAKASPSANTATLGFVRTAPWVSRAGFPGSFYLSGVLYGHFEATAEELDAQECTNCGARVLSERDDDAQECRSHGWFCAFECRRQVCPPNRGAGLYVGCWEA